MCIRDSIGTSASDIDQVAKVMCRYSGPRMKSVLVVCEQGVDAIALVAAAGRGVGVEVSAFEGSVQLKDSRNRLLTAFEDDEDGRDWLPGGLSRFRNNGLEAPRAFVIECRWEDLLCRVLRFAAQNTPNLFVVDVDGAVHVASDLDEATISL